MAFDVSQLLGGLLGSGAQGGLTSLLGGSALGQRGGEGQDPQGLAGALGILSSGGLPALAQLLGGGGGLSGLSSLFGGAGNNNLEAPPVTPVGIAPEAIDPRSLSGLGQNFGDSFQSQLGGGVNPADVQSLSRLLAALNQGL